jgi:hypothetical protein
MVRMTTAGDLHAELYGTLHAITSPYGIRCSAINSAIAVTSVKCNLFKSSSAIVCLHDDRLLQ